MSADIARGVEVHCVLARRYASTLDVYWNRIKHADALTDYRTESLPDDAHAYLLTATATDYVIGGFVVKASGELVGLWSRGPGWGDVLAANAVARGATYLDCFDGYLPTFYARHGFQRVTSLPNWTPDGPDVVYMALPDHFLRAQESAERDLSA